MACLHLSNMVDKARVRDKNKSLIMRFDLSFFIQVGACILSRLPLLCLWRRDSFFIESQINLHEMKTAGLRYPADDIILHTSKILSLFSISLNRQLDFKSPLVNFLFCNFSIFLTLPELQLLLVIYTTQLIVSIDNSDNCHFLNYLFNIFSIYRLLISIFHKFS